MKTTRWTDKQGREFVQQWQSSGQSMSAFVRERGENVQRLRYWRERVEGKSARRGDQRRTRTRRGNRLIPGMVVGIGARAAVTVHLSRGVVVEVQAARELDPRWLAELARALEQLS